MKFSCIFRVWVLGVLVLAQELTFAACAIRTADPAAERNVCSIVTWLYSLPNRQTNNILSGQYGWKDTEAIHDITGKWPAFLEDHLWQKGVQLGINGALQNHTGSSLRIIGIKADSSVFICQFQIQK